MDSGQADSNNREQIVLNTVAGWESQEWGYTTGGAFIDIDNDGDLDVAVAEGNDMSPGHIRVYENNHGIIETQANLVSETAHFHGHLSVGDVNGDGWTDVVVSRFLGDTGFDMPGGVSVYLNEVGTLSRTPTWVWDGAYSFSCALGDMDNDGDLDMALAVGEAYYNEPDYSIVFENNGHGDYTLVWQTETPRHSFDVAWVDINADGFLDLAFANAQSPHAAYLSEQGVLPSFASWEAREGPFEGNTLDFEDVNQDGFPDLLISDNNQLGGLGTVRLFCGPDLELCWETTEDSQMWSAVTIQDVDDDGDFDLLAGAWWGAVEVFRNDEGFISTETVKSLGHDEMVVEALAWGAVSDFQSTLIQLEGSGLMRMPKGAYPISIQAGVVGDGYISGPSIRAQVRHSPADMLLTDWTPDQGNVIFFRKDQSDMDSASSN